MTKIREPRSVEEAIEFCCKTLKYERAAEIVGRHVRSLTCWHDPDDERHINARAIVQLDVAMRAAGHGTPISSALIAAIDESPSAREGANSMHDIAAITVALGGFAAKVMDGYADGHLDDHERRAAIASLIDVIREAEKALETLRPTRAAVTPAGDAQNCRKIA